jgi:hypothetical protein
MLKDLRSLEDALNEKRIELQDNARLLDELTADKKALSAFRLPEDLSTLLENAKARITGSGLGSDVAKGILDDLLKVQTAFALPFNQIVDSLSQERPYSRSLAANQTTASLANLMYPLINKQVYTTDIATLKAKIAAGRAEPGDFPTNFTKDDFNKLRDDLAKTFDVKIGELTSNAGRLNADVMYRQKVVDNKERDLRSKVDDQDKRNKSYYYLGGWGFLSMTTVLLAALVSLFFVARNAHLSGFLREFIRWNPLLDLSTVFILALAIIMLGLNDKLSPEVLGTLLGGISGYVLGRASRSASASAERAELKTLLQSKPSGGSGVAPDLALT